MVCVRSKGGVNGRSAAKVEMKRRRHEEQESIEGEKGVQSRVDNVRYVAATSLPLAQRLLHFFRSGTIVAG